MASSIQTHNSHQNHIPFALSTSQLLQPKSPTIATKPPPQMQQLILLPKAGIPAEIHRSLLVLQILIHSLRPCHQPRPLVVDVGGGTGFTTLGIVQKVDAKNVTILDQSPHQLAKAKEQEPLKECKIIEGDAENLPFPTDYADRYISAGRSHFFH